MAGAKYTGCISAEMSVLDKTLNKLMVKLQS